MSRLVEYASNFMILLMGWNFRFADTPLLRLSANYANLTIRASIAPLIAYHQ